MAQFEDEARDALLNAIRDKADRSPTTAELRTLAEAFALTTGNVAVTGVSAERFAEALAAHRT